MFWCVDMRRAARMIGWPVIGDELGFEITRDAYSVCIVQADKKEETKDGNS
jgi:hypothetical protein